MPRPWGAITGIGITTIVAYGGWFYGFGVLLQAIADDTGWTIGALGSTFAAAQVASGVGAIGGGRLLDRLGGRTSFLLGGLAGGALLAAAATARELWAFAILFTLAAGLIGGLGFYHATMAEARRMAPEDPVRTIGPLTIWGAFSSPIFLPLTAVLVEQGGWRVALLVLAGLTAAGMVVGAVLIGPRRPPLPDEAPPGRLGEALREVAHDPAARRLAGFQICSGVGIGVLLTYQVPIMTSLGLPLATAASVAGARGLLQLGGRIGLPTVVRAVGARRLLACVGLLSAVATVLLAVSGSLVVAALFALTAGVAIGAGSPLTGIRGAEVLPTAHTGALMGAMHTLHSGAGAAGPLLGAASVSLTGGYTPALAICTLLFLAAAALLWAPEPAVSAAG